MTDHPMTTPDEVAAGLGEDARKALLGAHRLSDQTDERAIYHLTSATVCQELIDHRLIWGNRMVRRAGLAIRALIQTEGGQEHG